MNILFLTGREVSYPVNDVLLKSFRQFSSVDVVEQGYSGKSILRRSLRVLLQSLPVIRSRNYDLIFVGFYGHFLVPAVRLLTRTPILFHPLISTYDTLVNDRKKISIGSPVAKLPLLLDRVACRSSDHILLDTRANADYIAKLVGLPRENFSTVFAGSDETIFFPRPAHRQSGQTQVLYQGSFLPLHGIDVILDAACLLKDDPSIQFLLIGGGMERERIGQLVKSRQLANIAFHPPVPVEQMPDYLAEASICLGGHFGSSEKAARVIAGKTFQDIAMGRATIVGENPANHELLTHGKDAWFTPMNSPADLADSILSLSRSPDLREQIGQNARQTFLRYASIQAIAPRLQSVVEQVLKRSR